MPAIVAIVGRPNVGKSTLFNRLLRQNLAIIHDEPGVTRDRLYAETEIGGRRVALVDTGGLTVVETPGADVREGIFNQAREAVEEAQAILLVMDGREGLTPLDQSVAEFIRRSGKPTLLAVNKVDGEEQEGLRTAEFHARGPSPWPRSPRPTASAWTPCASAWPGSSWPRCPSRRNRISRPACAWPCSAGPTPASPR